MKPRIFNGILVLVGIVVWLIILMYHISEVIISGNASASLDFAVGDIWYRVVQVAFVLTHGLLISRLFAHIDKLQVTTLLWQLFMIGMGGIVIVMLITIGTRMMEHSILFRYLQPTFFALGYYALIIFLLSSVFIYRRFILFPRTRRKILGWNLFLGFQLLALILYVLPGIFNEGPILVLRVVLFLILVLVLAANVRWIPYLNFNQKLRALGLFVLIEVVMGTFLVAGQKLPTQLQLGSIQNDLPFEFLTFIVMFVILYSGFSILVLFFNLPTSSVFESSRVEIASFSKINQAIQSNLDFSEILNTMLDASMLETGARGGWLEWLDEQGDTVVRERRRISEGDLTELKEHLNLTEKVLKDQRYLLLRNLKKNRSLRSSDTRFRSLLVVPILSNSRSFGAIYLVNDLVNAFEDVSVQAVVNFAEQAGIALENAQLIKNSIEVERYQEQLKIAKEVQSKLLPAQLPESPKVVFAALSENAYEVGGDYYDVTPYGDHRFRVAIGDVSGKGTTAAFYMAEIKGIFHALVQLDLSVQQFISTANHALAECLQQGFFVTLTYLEIDTEQRQIELLRAGHTPTLLYRQSQDCLEYLRDGTLGLGILRNHSFDNYLTEPTRIAYEPGDRLVLYTDGILEARNTDGDEFGYDRFQELVRTHVQDAPDMLAAAIVKAVKSFTNRELDDDYTVLIISLK